MDKIKYPETFTSSDFVNKNDLELIEGKAPIWWNYFLCGVKGVVGELLHHDGKDGHSNGVDEAKNFGFIALMDGKIPPSAGLSSSSAVVVAAAVCKCSYCLCNSNRNSYIPYIFILCNNVCDLIQFLLKFFQAPCGRAKLKWIEPNWQVSVHALSVSSAHKVTNVHNHYFL